MVKAAIEGNPVFKLSRVEIDRHPPHYAVDTVALLRAQYPEAELIYLMGGDSLRDLPAWHRPVEFVHACQALGVMNRPGVRVNIEYLEEQIPGIVKKILLFEAPLLEISASQIRQRVANGKPIRYFVPEAVHALICEYSLYRA
jgi:nicotinate-nucleotide adenylyltransferase